MVEQKNQPNLFERLVQSFFPALLFIKFVSNGANSLITKPLKALLSLGFLLTLMGLISMFTDIFRSKYKDQYCQAYSWVYFGTFLLLPCIYAFYKKQGILNYFQLTLWIAAGIHVLLGVYLFIKSREQEC